MIKYILIGLIGTATVAASEAGDQNLNTNSSPSMASSSSSSSSSESTQKQATGIVSYHIKYNPDLIEKIKNGLGYKPLFCTIDPDLTDIDNALENNELYIYDTEKNKKVISDYSKSKILCAFALQHEVGIGFWTPNESHILACSPQQKSINDSQSVQPSFENLLILLANIDDDDKKSTKIYLATPVISESLEFIISQIKALDFTITGMSVGNVVKKIKKSDSKSGHKITYYIDSLPNNMDEEETYQEILTERMVESYSMLLNAKNGDVYVERD